MEQVEGIPGNVFALEAYNFWRRSIRLRRKGRTLTRTNRLFNRRVYAV